MSGQRLRVPADEDTINSPSSVLPLQISWRHKKNNLQDNVHTSHWRKSASSCYWKDQVMKKKYVKQIIMAWWILFVLYTLIHISTKQLWFLPVC
jgi:hypothetical protein